MYDGFIQVIRWFVFAKRWIEDTQNIVSSIFSARLVVKLAPSGVEADRLLPYVFHSPHLTSGTIDLKNLHEKTRRSLHTSLCAQNDCDECVLYRRKPAEQPDGLGRGGRHGRGGAGGQQPHRAGLSPRTNEQTHAHAHTTRTTTPPASFTSTHKDWAMAPLRVLR